jgi:hypothetical protein
MWVPGLATSHGVESIRYALVSIVTLGNAWAAVHYLLAGRTLTADLEVKDC